MDKLKDNYLELEELKKLVEKIIKTEFPDDYEKFSEENKKFIIKYSIKKNPSANEVLENINSEIKGVDKYYEEYPKVKELTALLQKRYNTFKKLIEREPKAFYNDLDNNDFSLFLDWHCSQESKCYYCGVSSSTLEKAFERNHGKPLISSKKRSFSAELQIDKKNPENGYNKDNCVLACALCNNAKSDMISAEDFKKFIAPAFSNYWKEIKKRLKENKGEI